MTAFVITRMSSISSSLAPNEITSLAARRDADRVEWRGRANALSVVMARHAGIEPTWACHRPHKSSAPLFFPHRSLGGRKWEGERGGVALWKESYPWAQRGKTETLAMRVVSPAERSVSMGFRQAWHTLSVSVISKQGRPLRLTMTMRHLKYRKGTTVQQNS